MPNIRANLKPNTDKALTPLAYSLRSITLTNHAGLQADIQNIVVDFSITESLYTAALIARFNIKDVANFIEEYQLIGQETIEVHMGRHDYTSPDWTDVKIKFYVTEYPMYGRDRQQTTQVYSITGVTRHAYISTFKRISRTVAGRVSDEIRKILSTDLLTETIGTIDPTSSRFHGVIPLSHPLDAAYWLLRRAYDDQANPFFLHETLRTGVNLRSLSNLISDDTNPVYREYRDTELFQAIPGSKEDFQERIENIYDVSSEFKLSKVLPTLSGGAYASRAVFVDASSKTISNYTYDYNKKFVPSQTMNGYSVLSNKFTVPYELPSATKTINQMPDGFVEYIPTNKYAFSQDGSFKSYHDVLLNTSGHLNSNVETFDTIVHDIMVAGDFKLQSGMKVAVHIPKAIEPNEFNPATLNGKFDDIFDRTVSGKYIISAITHQFGEKYFCKLRLKRESFTYDVNKT